MAESDPVLSKAKAWRAAYAEHVRWVREQARLETELVQRVGFPGIDVKVAGKPTPAFVQDAATLQVLLGKSAAAKTAERELRAALKRWKDEAAKSGYSDAKQREKETGLVAERLAKEALTAKARTIEGAIAKLDILLEVEAPGPDVAGAAADHVGPAPPGEDEIELQNQLHAFVRRDEAEPFVKADRFVATLVAGQLQHHRAARLGARDRVLHQLLADTLAAHRADNTHGFEQGARRTAARQIVQDRQLATADHHTVFGGDDQLVHRIGFDGVEGGAIRRKIGRVFALGRQLVIDQQCDDRDNVVARCGAELQVAHSR
jgi:hypothetical protein